MIKMVTTKKSETRDGMIRGSDLPFGVRTITVQGNFCMYNLFMWASITWRRQFLSLSFFYLFQCYVANHIFAYKKTRRNQRVGTYFTANFFCFRPLRGVRDEFKVSTSRPTWEALVGTIYS